MKISNFFKTLGPGLLYAGAAVGVSHLVQSTRAGAGYGFELLWIIILVHILKYPFFQFGPRYAASTGKSLIEGYRKIGKWAVVLFLILTLSTVFTIQAAVTIVTSGILANVFGIMLSPVVISAMILSCSAIVLMIGRYNVLDKLIRYIIIILSVSTIIAVGSAFGIDQNATDAPGFDWGIKANIFFLIAFIGWMPAPIDLSVWHSLWSVAKNKGKNKLNLKQSLTDFNVGFFGTAVLALSFLSLGAIVMHGSGEVLSSKGDIFAGQLITMYTSSMGSWAYLIIATAALATMLSTTLTALDANPRVLATIFTTLNEKHNTPETFKKLYWGWLVIVLAGTLVLMVYLSQSMKFLVDLATTLSFITAPLIAWLNYKVITNKEIPEHARIKPWMKIYSGVGIAFLASFSVVYIIWNFFIA
ncbi:MAG: divalent metal cation transporter [Bacteroidales bacterium]|nr:divalent metal cation transporter [Bacteroidales bacterium]